MNERRRIVRRQADRDLLLRLQHEHAHVHHGEHGSDESRRLRRHAIRHHCQVVIRLQMGYSSGSLDTWSVDAVKIKGRILDLSKGGASLFTGESFQTGQELLLTIILEDSTEITAKAVVRWVKSVPEKRGYASGVQFSHVSPTDTLRIEKFLEQLDATLGL